MIRRAYFSYASRLRRTDETELVVLLDIFLDISVLEILVLDKQIFRHFGFRNKKLDIFVVPRLEGSIFKHLAVI